MLMTAAWLFALAETTKPMTAPQPLIIDGGSVYPPEQSVSYNFRCPDGMVTMEIAQKHQGTPIVMKLRYGGHPIARAAIERINRTLRQIRTVASVAPRCFTGGGMQMLLGGVTRKPATDERTIITLNIDATGRVQIN